MVTPKYLKLLALETSVLLTETDIEDILHNFLSLPIIIDRVLFKFSVSLFCRLFARTCLIFINLTGSKIYYLIIVILGKMKFSMGNKEVCKVFWVMV